MPERPHDRTPVPSDAQLSQVIANYDGMIALADHGIGRVLTELHRLGLADNTLVVVSSDHGDWLGDHGLLPKGPMANDGLLRVVGIMRGPGLPKGAVCDQPVSSLDFGATFLDQAGVARPELWHGRSLLAVARGEETRGFATHASNPAVYERMTCDPVAAVDAAQRRQPRRALIPGARTR